MQIEFLYPQTEMLYLGLDLFYPTVLEGKRILRGGGHDTSF